MCSPAGCINTSWPLYSFVEIQYLTAKRGAVDRSSDAKTMRSGKPSGWGGSADQCVGITQCDVDVDRSRDKTRQWNWDLWLIYLRPGKHTLQAVILSLPLFLILFLFFLACLCCFFTFLHHIYFFHFLFVFQVLSSPPWTRVSLSTSSSPTLCFLFFSLSLLRPPSKLSSCS